MGFRIRHKKVREACTRLLKKNGNQRMTSQQLISNITKVDGKTPFSPRQIGVKPAGLTVSLRKDMRFETDGELMITYLTGHKSPVVCWKLSEYGLNYVSNKY